MDTPYTSLRPDQRVTRGITGDQRELAGGSSSLLGDAKDDAILTIAVRPERRGSYLAFLNGKLLGKRGSRTPFFTAARKLLAHGVDPATPFVMRHEGSPIVALRSTVGAAARLMVMENDRGIQVIPYDPVRLNALQQHDRRPRIAIYRKPMARDR